MTPWTALLESLHSSLIDELTERHPDPKPELGMPVRQNRLAFPAPGITQTLICPVDFSSAQGIVLVAFEPAFMKNIKLTPEKFWDALLKRSGSEFSRRNIRPKMGSPEVCHLEIQLPKGLPDPTRIVWIPFKIPSGICYLGMGV